MQKFFPLFLSLSLAGCAVGPDYESPKLDLPKDWHAEKPTINEENKAKNVNWWISLNDPKLNDLMKRALYENQSLKIATARILEARGMRKNSEAGLSPEINGTTIANKGNQGVSSLGGNLTLYQANFDASWELDFFGGTQRKIEAQIAYLEARHFDYKQAWLTLTAEVGQEYINYRQLQHQLKLTLNTVETQHKLLEITKDRLRGGLVSALDHAQADTLYKTTLARLPTLERQLAASGYRLSILLGEAPGQLNDELSECQPLPTPQLLSILDAPANIIATHPGVKSAERELAAATALHGVAISEIYPKISLSALLGIQNSKIPSSNFAFNRNIWGLGGNISFPLLEFGSIEGKINAAEARQTQAFHHYKHVLLMTLGEVETSISNLSKEKKRSYALEEAAIAAKNAVKIAHDRYRQGLIDFTSVLQVEDQNYSVHHDLVGSQSEVIKAIIAIYKSVGAVG